MRMDAEEQRLARKSARQARRKEEIVRAAIELAARVGLDGFTADDVGRALSMSTPSVFYYFPGGLDELRAAAALRRFYARTESVEADVAAAPTGVAALTTLLRGFVRVYHQDPDGLAKDLEVMMRGAWGHELVQTHIARLNGMFTVIDSKLQADRAAGRLHDAIEHPRRLGMLMNQLAIGLLVGDQMIKKVGGGRKHTLDALLDDLCGLLERGTAAATRAPSAPGAPIKKARARPRRARARARTSSRS